MIDGAVRRPLGTYVSGVSQDDLEFLWYVLNRGGVFTRETVMRWHGVTLRHANRRIAGLIEIGLCRMEQMGSGGVRGVYSLSPKAIRLVGGRSVWRAVRYSVIGQLEGLLIANFFAMMRDLYNVLDRDERVPHLVSGACITKEALPLSVWHRGKSKGLFLSDEVVVEKKGGRTWIAKAVTDCDEAMLQRHFGAWSIAARTGDLGFLLVASNVYVSGMATTFCPTGSVDISGPGMVPWSTVAPARIHVDRSAEEAIGMQDVRSVQDTAQDMALDIGTKGKRLKMRHMKRRVA